MADNADCNVGRVLRGNYRIEARIGEGGMGTVYRGLQLSINRPVAIKLLSTFGNNVELRKRFQREAESTAQLDTPHIVRVIDFGVTEQGELFLIMELLKGMDLSQHLEKVTRMASAEAFEVCQQVLEALVEAHGKCVFHRDIKPSNIFLCMSPGGAPKVKLLDFGIAGLDPSAKKSKLTLTGRLLGTPAYMSPEQAQGLELDARTDLYSLGIALFEMLTGELPFDAITPPQFLIAHMSHTPRRLPAIGLPAAKHSGVQSLLDKLLAKAPEERFASANEARAAIERLSALSDAPAMKVPAVAVVKPQADMRTVRQPKPAPPQPWHMPASAPIGVATGAVVAAAVLVLALNPSTPPRARQMPTTTVSGATQADAKHADALPSATTTITAPTRNRSGLTPEQLNPVVRAGYLKLKRCFDAAMRKSGAPQPASSKVEVEIEPSGSVKAATVADGSPDLQECVARTVKAWKFPSTVGSTRTRFAVPSVAVLKQVIPPAEPPEPEATGPDQLSADELSKVVMTKRLDLQRCYSTALRVAYGAPSVALDLEIQIAPSGIVTNVSMTEGLPGMKECIVQAVNSWRFPRAREATVTRFPVKFVPGTE
jgi:serine/threonine-protein kinase